MIDWSCETLSDEERLLLRWLAVFRGAFPLDAAEAIGKEQSREHFDPIDILDKLVRKSLVSVDSRGGGRVRLPLLDRFGVPNAANVALM
jgi:predicted ATPase